jgi:endoglucanase
MPIALSDMPSFRTFRRLLLAALLPAAVAISAPAAASANSSGGYQFTSPNLTVNESAGNAVITITRGDASRSGHVGYITLGITAESPYDYTPEKATVDFAAGQSSATFNVPIIDHGIDGMNKTIKLALYGGYPNGVGQNHVAVLTILNNDPLGPTNSLDPLGLPNATTTTDPLDGATFYVDPDSEAARAAKRYPTLNVIADQPGIAKFGRFSYPNAEISVSRYLAKASVLQPNAIPMLATYWIVGAGHCGGWSDPASRQQAYHNFISGFAQGIGSYRAVLFLEEDSLITAGCLSRQGVAVRMGELSDAIAVLQAECPHLVIYLDAGAADATPAHRIAQLLQMAGVSKVQGFFLNSTHFDWTLNEIHYGDDVSALTGGKHFVVSTGESGRGPLVPADRVTGWAPSRRGTPASRTSTRSRGSTTRVAPVAPAYPAHLPAASTGRRTR